MSASEYRRFAHTLPREIYDEVWNAIELAYRMGANNVPEALSYIAGEFRATWEAAEAQRVKPDQLAYLRTEVFNRDSWSCQMTGCGKRTTLTVHHITPLSAGGDRVESSNLVTLCSECHERLTTGDGRSNWKALAPQLRRRVWKNERERSGG